jgi:hypothetical protein
LKVTSVANKMNSILLLALLSGCAAESIEVPLPPANVANAAKPQVDESSNDQPQINEKPEFELPTAGSLEQRKENAELYVARLNARLGRNSDAEIKVENDDVFVVMPSSKVFIYENGNAILNSGYVNFRQSNGNNVSLHIKFDESTTIIDRIGETKQQLMITHFDGVNEKSGSTWSDVADSDSIYDFALHMKNQWEETNSE